VIDAALHKPTSLKLLAVPFDGNHESSAADTLMFLADKLVLIEFKRTVEHFKNEYEKFGGKEGFEAAQAELKDCGGHHWFVYGVNVGNDLTLGACHYFDWTSEIADPVGSLKQFGISKDDFFDYQRRLMSFKKNSDKGGGSGQVALDDHCMVAGVRADGKCVGAIPISEYLAKYQLDLTLDYEPGEFYSEPRL